jgi:hypothetical protein
LFKNKKSLFDNIQWLIKELQNLLGQTLIFAIEYIDPRNPFDRNDWTLNSAGKLLKSKKVQSNK